MNKESWNSANVFNINNKKKVEFLCDNVEIIDPKIEKILSESGFMRLIQPFCNDGIELIYLCTKYDIEGYGIDFSNVAIDRAKKNSEVMNANCNFIEEDINLYRSNNFSCKFDLMFTTLGSLFWICKLDDYFSWAHDLIVEGGSIAIWDFHPNIFQFNADSNNFDGDFVYGEKKILYQDGIEGYIDRTMFFDNEIDQKIEFKNIYPVEYKIHSISSIINSAIKHNFSLKTILEFPYVYGEKWDDYYEEKSKMKYNIPSQRISHSLFLEFQK